MEKINNKVVKYGYSVDTCKGRISEEGYSSFDSVKDDLKFVVELYSNTEEWKTISRESSCIYAYFEDYADDEGEELPCYYGAECFE